MASCLGLYVEKKLIKYAKVSKSNDSVKIEGFGIKFYEDLETTVKQIVEETYSFKNPISINLTDELYNKIDVFSLLSKKDMDGAIKTEFENICYDEGINRNLYEQKYLFTDNKGEKVKVLHIAALKTTIAQKKNQFLKYRINNMSPMSVTIPNLISLNKKTNALIVNIEKDTTITKMSGEKVTEVNVISTGAEEILEKIKQKENSYSKAYEICKNSTIYTEQDKDLQYEENEYLEDIMPTLFEIVSQVRRIVDESMQTIEEVYITGTGTIVNNIDIYFQEYLGNIHCEILKPSFVVNNSKINIKDYIEVNSAISLALQGVNKDNNINFTKESFLEKSLGTLKKDGSKPEIKLPTQSINEFIEKFNRQYKVAAYSFVILAVVYIISGYIINNQIEKKILLANNSINNTNTRISKIQTYNNIFNDQITGYEDMITNIENANNINSEDKRYKNTIPNLLNNVMAVIPKEVQLTLIENTSNTHIRISAQSIKYEQIAYFKTKLKTEGILKNVLSDTGTMQNGNLVVTIEGELP